MNQTIGSPNRPVKGIPLDKKYDCNIERKAACGGRFNMSMKAATPRSTDADIMALCNKYPKKQGMITIDN